MAKYLLRYSSDVVKSPVLAKTVLETKVLINVLRAEISYDEASIIVDVPGDEKTQEKVVKAFKSQGIEVVKLDEGIVRDIKGCIDCGACIAVCPVEAIYFKEDLSIEIDRKECIRCGSCVEVCPFKAIKIQEL
ncbi:MAG TPA: 4Fe-4S dicluster domain-containing protein [Candidatus Altiarchaeales archaeon]|nr:MAG: [Fe-S]-binding protein [Candidatus Altiarchaeales archaeon]HDN83019.1 4Fe-4S dicluster domain-containing protein [Candidatus Altiarchaeales archaeon]